jgi:hypothetical protein
MAVSQFNFSIKLNHIFPIDFFIPYFSPILTMDSTSAAVFTLPFSRNSSSWVGHFGNAEMDGPENQCFSLALPSVFPHILLFYFSLHFKFLLGWFSAAFDALFDFPPLLWLFDAHSLFHLFSAPVPLIWAEFVCQEANRREAVEGKGGREE